MSEVIQSKSFLRKISSLGSHICKGNYLGSARPAPVYLNREILKSQKLLAKLTFKWHTDINIIIKLC